MRFIVILFSLMVFGCATQQELVFVSTQDYGFHVGASPSTQEFSFIVGGKIRDVALIPVTESRTDDGAGIRGCWTTSNDIPHLEGCSKTDGSGAVSGTSSASEPSQAKAVEPSKSDGTLPKDNVDKTSDSGTTSPSILRPSGASPSITYTPRPLFVYPPDKSSDKINDPSSDQASSPQTDQLAASKSKDGKKSDKGDKVNTADKKPSAATGTTKTPPGTDTAVPITPGTTEASVDAVSVFSSFNESASGQKDGANFSLGKVFATGVAAQKVSDAVKTFYEQTAANGSAASSVAHCVTTLQNARGKDPSSGSPVALSKDEIMLCGSAQSSGQATPGQTTQGQAAQGQTTSGQSSDKSQAASPGSTAITPVTKEPLPPAT